MSLALAFSPVSPSTPHAAPPRSRTRSRALISRVGSDEITPRGVARAFAIDLGGSSPARVSLAFPSDADAVVVSCTRPLGIVFVTRTNGIKTEIVVDEVTRGGAASNAGVAPGDVLRLTTAVFSVSAPVDVTTWLNPPKKRNALAYYECDGKSFDDVMRAIASHSVEIDTPRGKETTRSVGMVFSRARPS